MRNILWTWGEVGILVGKNLINVQECGLVVGVLDVSPGGHVMLTWGPGMNLNSRGGRRGWCRLTYQGRWPPLCPAFGRTSRCHSDSPLSAGCMLGPGSRSSECPSNSLDRGVYATPHACAHSYGTGLGCPFCLPVYPLLCPTRTLQPRLPCDHCFRKAIPRRFFFLRKITFDAL